MISLHEIIYHVCAIARGELERSFRRKISSTRKTWRTDHRNRGLHQKEEQFVMIMKSRKTADPVTIFNPEEACASFATDALKQGSEPPLGHYTHDLAEALKRLANQFDPSDGAQPQWQFEGPAKRRAGTKQIDAEDEWEGSIDQICGAIENGSTVSIGSYLHDAATFLSRLAMELDPQGPKGRRLEFVYRGSGRPKDTSTAKKLADRATRARIAAVQRKFDKQEAAIAELQKTGVSRSSYYRKKGKSPTSHKKR